MDKELEPLEILGKKFNLIKLKVNRWDDSKMDTIKETKNWRVTNSPRPWRLSIEWWDMKQMLQDLGGRLWHRIKCLRLVPELERRWSGVCCGILRETMSKVKRGISPAV